MSDPLVVEDDASTPLDPDERADLIPAYITLRSELNEAEQVNIAEAEEWAFNRTRDVPDERFLLDLHRRMFRHVWKWAGRYRTTERNIGVDPIRIQVELYQLLDTVRYWVENKTFDPDEIAMRFHHKLVWIHPFPKGNGRHSRLATDLLLEALGQEGFTWGRINLVDPTETRRAYVAALHAADNHDYEALKRFVRS